MIFLVLGECSVMDEKKIDKEAEEFFEGVDKKTVDELAEAFEIIEKRKFELIGCESEDEEEER